MRIRIFLMLALGLPLPVMADAPPPVAVAAAPATSIAASAGTTAKLGKVEVTGTQPLVETLQQMKTAIDSPYSNDPDHYDDMVCRILDDDGFRAEGALLDCGTQGYYNMRRSIMHRDMKVRTVDVVAATPTLGHPWHAVRLLDYEELTALRRLLIELPLLGQGTVQVVDEPTPPPAAATH